MSKPLDMIYKIDSILYELLEEDVINTYLEAMQQVDEGDFLPSSLFDDTINKLKKALELAESMKIEVKILET